MLPFTVDPQGETLEGRMRRRRMLQTALMICLMLLLLDSGPNNQQLRGGKGKGLHTETEPHTPPKVDESLVAELNAFYDALPPQDHYYAYNATGYYRGAWDSVATPPPESSGRRAADAAGLKLQSKGGRAALQLHMQSLAGVEAVSAIWGYLRFFDGLMSTPRDVLVAVQGVVFHQTGRLRLNAVEHPKATQNILLPVTAGGGGIHGNASASAIGGDGSGDASDGGPAADPGRRLLYELPATTIGTTTSLISPDLGADEAAWAMALDEYQEARRDGRGTIGVLADMAARRLYETAWGWGDTNSYPAEHEASWGGISGARRLEGVATTLGEAADGHDHVGADAGHAPGNGTASTIAAHKGIKIAMPTGYMGSSAATAAMTSRAGADCKMVITGDMWPRIARPDDEGLDAAAADAMRRAAATKLMLSARSKPCEVDFNLTVSMRRVDWKKASAKATNYSITMTLAAVLQIFALVRQLQYTNTQAAAARMSLVCIAMQGLMDALLCILHLLVCVTQQPLFAAFASVAFFKLITFCIFEMRYMVVIFQARQDQDSFRGGWVEIRRRLAALHARFYGVLMALLVFIYLLNIFAPAAVPFALLLGHSFWVPQIVSNVRRESRAPLCRTYLFTMSCTRLLLPLYLYGCPASMTMLFEARDASGEDGEGDNMVNATNLGFCVTLVLWVGAQTLMLLLQEKYGPTFFVPAFMLPPKYDYRKPIPEENFNEDGQATCVICICELNNLDNTMVAPCQHAFHADCLTRWMEERQECPVCRAPLPPP
mmetsp:Transcript_16114/g.49254  ORF Transcript_16114/g.49254 Transcript_16114/m.49254 type:complete len:774 (-) Transcript_16114:94-2415(-)